MILKNLQLHNFRVYAQRSFLFKKKTTVFIGENAVGKTNILEAVMLLSRGKSFRASKDEEMILFGEDFARISGEIDDESLEIFLSRGVWQGKKVAKKRFLVNGVAKRRKDFVSRLKAILFEPEDIEIVIGSPGKRRDYLDSVLSQADSEYSRCLLSFEKGLRQRNRLLSLIAEGKAKLLQLEFWDRLLAKNGEIIFRKREAYLEFLNEFCRKESLEKYIEAMPELAVKLPGFKFEYDPSVISLERITKYRQAELASGKTLIGPHRDDFVIFQLTDKDKAKNLATYGSRGEQRTGVLVLKMAELEFLKQKTAEEPILLLDDIFSELDLDHQKIVLVLVDNHQSIITATDLDPVLKTIYQNKEVVKLTP
jgi:DNA replication and repair protein RecF